jgi:hypothetical protein
MLGQRGAVGRLLSECRRRSGSARHTQGSSTCSSLCKCVALFRKCRMLSSRPCPVRSRSAGPAGDFLFLGRDASLDPTPTVHMTARAYVRHADGSLKDLGFVSGDAAESGPETFLVEPSTSARRSAIISDRATYRKWLVSLTHRQRCVELDGPDDIRWWNGAALTYTGRDQNIYAMTPDGHFSTVLVRNRASNLIPLGERSLAVVVDHKLVRFDLPAYEPGPEPAAGDGHENDCAQDAPPADIGTSP